MALSAELRRRIEAWKEELTRHFYTPLGTFEVQGFTTYEMLTIEDARKGKFKRFPAGTKWGAKWEYGWFKASIVLPEEARAKRIVADINVGGESAVFINGVAAGCVRRYEAWQMMNPVHLNRVTLGFAAVPGECFELLMECYSGHGPRVAHTGPTPMDRLTVPEPKEPQVEVGTNSFGVWNEDVYQLWLDVESLFQIREKLDKESLRLAEIDKALKEFTFIVDFEVSFDEMLRSVQESRRKLKPLLECRNGTTMPEMFAFGHSHLDIGYMWTLKETRRKCARTLSTQIALMDEYPEYKYFQSQPFLLWKTKNDYPELFGRIKEKVSNGQIMPEGGMWVEADTNITGGESLVRQFIYGKRFLKEEFNVESEICWLPDGFGFSAALPQIMLGCGVKYFSSAKLFSGFSNGERFPYNVFSWEGIDGSKVLASLPMEYSLNTQPKDLINTWNIRVQKDNMSSMLYPFGHGDGGGGATRDHIEFLKRNRDLEGVPRIKIGHPKDYFSGIEQQGVLEERYTGELYFSGHRGTYTSQAKLKKSNRTSEMMLREAEMWSAAAAALGGYKVPSEELDYLWKLVLLNQFHDILPGSCIQKVAEEAQEAYIEVIKKTSSLVSEATKEICRKEEAITIFNSLSWQRSSIIELPEAFNTAVDEDGNVLEVQEVDSKKYVEVSSPSCGWTTFRSTDGEAIGKKMRVFAKERSLENNLIKIEFNDLGEITTIIDKESGKNIADGSCNSFKMYKDAPALCDAWEMDSIYENQPVELKELAKLQVVCEGPLFAKMKIMRRINNSELIQFVTLKHNSRRVDFHTTIDWRERHKLLKVCFPVDIHSNEAVHETQFGYVKRPNHRSRQFDADRFEVCNHKWTALMEENRGFAVLNDSKYGVSVFENSINLTLLKSALAPDMNADRGLQQFTYSFYLWNGNFADSDVIREAYELNCPVSITEGNGGSMSLFSVDTKNVIIETVKPAYDNSGDIIVRMYESKRTTTKCILNTALPAEEVYSTNMLEACKDLIAMTDRGIELELKPFEIATLRIKLKK
jgi:alpha-mannosidase